jgi:hypothetical protein
LRRPVEFGPRQSGSTAARRAELGSPYFAAWLAVVLTGAAFIAQARVGLQLSDEGFLWVGTTETLHGAVPIRDFFSYNPGRYLWSAAWSLVLGDGIIALRFAVAVFAAIGLFCGLRAAQRVIRNELALVAVGVLLLMWSFPRHKLFESAIAMMGVLVGVRLLEAPTTRRFFDTGVMVGVAFLFGMNHGPYLAFAFFVLLVFLFARERSGDVGVLRAGRALTAGTVVGSSPLLVMCVVIPGFASSYLEFIRYLIAQGRTNVSSPVPWPWLADSEGQFFLGLAMVLAPVAAVLLIAVSVWPVGSVEPSARHLALAAGSVGLVYMHHAFSRAGLSHLAQSIHPLLLGLVAVPRLFGGRRVFLAAVCGALALFTMRLAVPQSPLASFAQARETFEWTSVGGDRLLLPRDVSEAVNRVRAAVAAYVPRDEPLLVLPWYPGLYPLLDRRPPVWDTYPVWLDRRGADRRTISEIEQHDVKWMLAGRFAREEFSFRGNHPLVAAYLDARFERVPGAELPGGFGLYRLAKSR